MPGLSWGGTLLLLLASAVGLAHCDCKLPYIIIHVWRMGRLNTTFGQKCILYANYVPNRLRHGVLRDPNHSLRIEYALRWFSKLG
eukprot:COSAG05_NODE_729_length_7683_cov_4.662843_8_plen_84_part_01